MILILSLRYNFLKSINAVDRDSVGSIAYPVSVFGCYVAFEYTNDLSFYYLPILTLALCDPLAALAGKTWPVGKFKIGNGHKTVVGCLAFFFSAFALSFGFHRSWSPSQQPPQKR